MTGKLFEIFFRYGRYEKNRKSIINDKKTAEGPLIDLNDTGSEDVNPIVNQLSSLSVNSSTSSSTVPKTLLPQESMVGNKDKTFKSLAQNNNLTDALIKTE